jgi:hypothetical protein
MAEIVEHYLHAIASHDWDVVSECTSRPLGTRCAGRDEYLAFIADLLPKLNGYVMKLDRGTYATDALALAELSETAEFDDKAMVTPEVIVFELTGDHRIARIEIFIQTPAG